MKQIYTDRGMRMNAYEQLRSDILCGNLKPGERLLEEQLALRLQMSRTPIREAIRRLTSEGLLIHAQNRGVTVRTYLPDHVRDAYNLRAQVESYAAALAAGQACHAPESLMRLSEANKECEEMADRILHQKSDENVLAMVEANRKFHHQMATLSGNQYILEFLQTVMALPVTYNGFYWFSENELRESVQQHRMLFQAISNGDAEAARAIMASHIYHGRDGVLQHIADAPSSTS